MKKRVFSGVQPSASQVHIGNYLGAMKRFVELAAENETIFCLVDLHALTRVEKGEELKRNTLSLAAAYLAIGLDPEKTILFRQSDVPEVCELTWYLSCQFPLGLLERAHALKDARAKSKIVNSGVMFYPVLMAADILLYDATLIPVGADQKQHIEMTRDVAIKFNSVYGDVFSLPEPLIDSSTGIIPGLDGRKMSKSYDNYIGLFESEKELKKKVSRIVTDSKGVEDKKDPETCNVFALYKHFATKSELMDLAARYQAGGMGYGEAKQSLLSAISRTVEPLREKYERWNSAPNDLQDILVSGAKRARKLAQNTIGRVRDAVGVGQYL